jgi:methyltransferase OMS1, mitochondrial
MGITKLRKQLAAASHGHVLEVAVGTGRNLAYYDWSEIDEPDAPRVSSRRASSQGTQKQKESGRNEMGPAALVPEATGPVLSFTGVDISIDMLNVAVQKLARHVPQTQKSEPVITELGKTGRFSEVAYLDGKVRLVEQDARLSLPPLRASLGPGAKYDTVIQTFGLCSVSDPAKILANLADCVKPNSGRIILLEHGKGTWDLVNRQLDKYAPAHFQKYGCWWNRDIEGIVREAARTVPGLEVVHLERPYLLQMGTTLYIELRVRDNSK